MTEDWAAELQRGQVDRAWDLFLTRYRRLIFAAIRHYAQDYDDVMDVFTQACEALRANDFRRLRSYVERRDQARFSTWLVTVVRNLTIDWFRERNGRRRLPAIAESLPPLQRRIFQHVFMDRRPHLEAYELIRAGDQPALSFREFQTELRATYRAVANGRRGSVLRDLGGPIPEEPDPDDPSPLDQADARALVARILDSLNDEDRVAVELYVMEQLPADQVATVLGLPNAKAVYNRVYRALASLREDLERAGVRREDLL